MRRWFWLLLVASAIVAQPALALTDEEVFRDLRFNLINPINPGARSLAMGGAFVSLADDASAAQANPAGLPFLDRWEYFAELRMIGNLALSSVHTETLPGGVETFLATGTDMDDVVSPSFLSAVTTCGSKKRHWTMGLSRQELINLRAATLNHFVFAFPDSSTFLAEGTGEIDVNAVNYNVSLGFRITDEFGLGGTLTYSRLEVSSALDNQIVDIGGNLAENPILTPTLDLRTTIDDSDDDVVYSLGVLYRRHYNNAQNTWSVGAAYRRGPSFSVIEHIDARGTDLFEVRRRLGSRFTNRFSLPDVFGIGGSWMPWDTLTLSLEIDRILHSNLMDGFIGGVNILTDKDAEFTIDDATDYRFGAEYVVVTKDPKKPHFAIRAGAFTEEPANIRAVSTGRGYFASEEVFRGRDRQTHVTTGVGLIFPRYKLDFAMDFSDAANTFLLSFIYQGKP